jgi:hypothetical protein
MNTKRPVDSVDRPRPFLHDLNVSCPECGLTLRNMRDGTLLHESPPGSCIHAGRKFKQPTIRLTPAKP